MIEQDSANPILPQCTESPQFVRISQARNAAPHQQGRRRLHRENPPAGRASRYEESPRKNPGISLISGALLDEVDNDGPCFPLHIANIHRLPVTLL